MAEQRVTDHKVVAFTFVILDENRQVMEQSDLPISYVHGVDERIIDKLADAMAGHVVGDTIEVTLSPEEGFGEPDPSLTYTDDIENVPPEYRRIGAEAMFQNEAGDTRTMVVTKIEDGKVTLDGNHPYAGKTITYRLKIADIRDATAQEVGSGVVEDGLSALH